MSRRLIGNFRFFASFALALSLLLVVACGSAAPQIVEKEVIKEVPLEVEVAREVIKEVPVEIEKQVIKEVPVEVTVEKQVVKEVASERVVERVVIPTPIPVTSSGSQGRF